MSRNKEYIVFYRGNDFIAPKVRQVLVEKQEQAITQQDEEELARLKASASIITVPKGIKGPLVAGTLTETTEAKSRWGMSLNDKQREEEMKRLSLLKHTSLLKNLKRKLILVCLTKSLPATSYQFHFSSFILKTASHFPLYYEENITAAIAHTNYNNFFDLQAKTKVAKAERALAKVQEFLSPAELPTDLETVTDEERFLFRRIGLKMRAFLMLGTTDAFHYTVAI